MIVLTQPPNALILTRVNMMKLAKIKQLFPDDSPDSVEDEFVSILQSDKFKTAVTDRKRIAIAVGSRGIANLPMLVSKLVEHLKGLGIEPVITPAMGSHGHATAQGQEMVLNKLGISAETVGAKILSSMDVISLGRIQLDGCEFPAYVDKIAWQSDGVILINRVKPHTDYVGRYESGLVKMATVGLGNHKSAEQIHSLGISGLKKLMPSLAEVILGDDKIIGGLAITENALHKTADLTWLNANEILDTEPGILQKVRTLMPHFPINDIDLLIIKQMGKDISGVGIDTKIVGRIMIWGEEELSRPNIELIGLCDITDASYGNALGIGLADFITKRLFDRIDWHALKENILTATFYQRGKTPLVLADEREIITVANSHFQGRGRENPRVIIIKDTLNLSDMYVSEGVLDELENTGDIEIISEPQEIRFDDNNKIIAEL